MSSKEYGIEEARKVLGDLVTAAQQGTDIILTRNRRPVARITAYQEDTMTFADLAAHLGLGTEGAETIAQFAGALTELDPRTGRLPQRWTGQGVDFVLTRDEADEIAAEWDRTKRHVDAGATLPYVD